MLASCLPSASALLCRIVLVTRFIAVQFLTATYWVTLIQLVRTLTLQGMVPTWIRLEEVFKAQEQPLMTLTKSATWRTFLSSLALMVKYPRTWLATRRQTLSESVVTPQTTRGKAWYRRHPEMRMHSLLWMALVAPRPKRTSSQSYPKSEQIKKQKTYPRHR